MFVPTIPPVSGASGTCTARLPGQRRHRQRSQKTTHPSFSIGGLSTELFCTQRSSRPPPPDCPIISSCADGVSAWRGSCRHGTWRRTTSRAKSPHPCSAADDEKRSRPSPRDSLLLSDRCVRDCEHAADACEIASAPPLRVRLRAHGRCVRDCERAAATCTTANAPPLRALLRACRRYVRERSH